MKRRVTTILLCYAALMVSLYAGELAVGDAIPEFTVRDQFGKEFKFEAGLHYLLIGFDKDAGKQANLQLAGLGSGWLEKHQAAFLLDIHTMPAVARWFALPKMRKHPHRILLADNKDLLALYPRKTELITVLILDTTGKIRGIRYWNPLLESVNLEANNSDRLIFPCAEKRTA